MEKKKGSLEAERIGGEEKRKFARLVVVDAGGVHELSALGDAVRPRADLQRTRGGGSADALLCFALENQWEALRPQAWAQQQQAALLWRRRCHHSSPFFLRSALRLRAPL